MCIMTSPAERLRPLTIVGGDQGAGKSTLLRHQLLHGSCDGLAVVVSDLESLHLDDDAIVSREAGHLKLANGSTCWETRGDVTTTLTALQRHVQPSTRVLLEARHDASLRGFAGYAYTPGFRLDGIVVVAAADAIARDMEPSALTRTRNHTDCAEILVLNKLDLLSDPRPHVVNGAMAALRLTGPAILTSRGRVPSPLLLGVGPDESECANRAITATWNTSFKPLSGRVAVPTPPGAEREPAFRMWSLSAKEPITTHDFRRWLSRLPPTLTRARGFILFAGDPPYRYRFELVGPHHHLQRDDPWGEHAPETRLALVGV